LVSDPERSPTRRAKGDFKIMLGKSPPAYRQAGSPLFSLRARSPMGWRPKRGIIKGTFVLLEPITEGLRNKIKNKIKKLDFLK